MSKAKSGFDEQLGYVRQLIAIHEKLQVGAGRRFEQEALHRAGVVLIVASWQAYVERLVAEALDLIAAELSNPANASPSWAIHTFQLRRAAILNATKKFNTPDDVRVRDLVQDSFGFDPWPNWAWLSRRRKWSALETRQRTNQWVLIRHSIAHGFPLPNLEWLVGGNGQSRLTLNLLKECKKHFEFLVDKTDHAFADHLRAAYHIAQPW